MHELSIAQELLEIITRRASQEGMGKVEKVNLRIGEFSGVMPDALEFAFEMLSKGTLTEGASVEVEVVSPTFICERCGKTSPSPEGGCKYCGSEELTLKSGSELEITSFEGE